MFGTRRRVLTGCRSAAHWRSAAALGRATGQGAVHGSSFCASTTPQCPGLARGTGEGTAQYQVQRMCQPGRGARRGTKAYTVCMHNTAVLGSSAGYGTRGRGGVRCMDAFCASEMPQYQACGTDSKEVKYCRAEGGTPT